MKEKAITCALVALTCNLGIDTSTAFAANAADNISGHYVQKNCGDTLDVKLLPGKKIQIGLYCYYPAKDVSKSNVNSLPMVHTGHLQQTLPIKNNVAIHQTKGTKPLCQITFRFTSKSVTVSQVEKAMCACSFGTNVNASGVYTKLSKRPDAKAFEDGAD
jgi:hypothetical protein